ncbi:demethylmenaquinone methyltransferase/2-methoxy-6-polyprenyl-1,4-benzoquinol methylase [Desulfobaculum xiamenense]|uniref:Demethylmenaquinone methyltransferase/2-methoxy-6-polyprenyl-1,4-benzoquinol methylase n=1 Tax=Desulfobaculum xiamenense TaxID=995050 RepID=A0A846QMX8_9BACT|nr:class I SAM-dependent methyltransferase [Desulfobaculum xiamenense]NJB66594.1 demethylmenaquinone methyltransferase/2-methoxy-6-polyprenyl-1,4-benzoquinol methylase [Desulfobaculum xiamenense]
MYTDKAAFFDVQADARWAAAEYGPHEEPRLARLFDETGDLAGCGVLEPGCGTGRLTRLLAQRVGHEGFVLGMDVSPIMVERAHERLAGCANAEVRLGAIEDIPLTPQSFDLVLCHQVFPHIEDKATALARMAEALRPGQRLIINHFINSATINDHHRKAGTAVKHDTMPTPDVMRTLLDAAGFRIETVVDDELGYMLSARLTR